MLTYTTPTDTEVGNFLIVKFEDSEFIVSLNKVFDKNKLRLSDEPDEKQPLWAVNKFFSTRTKEQQRLWFNYARDVSTEIAGHYSQVPTQAYASINKSLSIDGFTMKDISLWCKKNLTIPDSIQAEYGAQYHYSRNKTFLKNEFFDLLVLSLYIKLLIPITSSYLRRFYETSKDHNELYLYREIAPIIDSFNGGIKLKEWIQANIGDSSSVSGSLVYSKMISGMEVVEYITASTIFKRIACAPLAGFTNTKHLVSYIHYYCDSKRKSIDTPGVLGEKLDNLPTDATDDSTGTFDDTRKRYQLTASEIATMHYTTEVEYLSNWLDTRIDIDKALSTAELLHGKLISINVAHLSILSGVFQNLIHPIIISYLDKQTVVRLLSFAHDLLIVDDQYREVAKVCLSTTKLVNGTNLPGETTISKLNHSSIEELSKAYPVRKVAGRRTFNPKELVILEHMSEVEKVLKYEQTYTYPGAEEDYSVTKNWNRIYANFLINIRTYLPA